MSVASLGCTQLRKQGQVSHSLLQKFWIQRRRFLKQCPCECILVHEETVLLLRHPVRSWRHLCWCILFVSKNQAIVEKTADCSLQSVFVPEPEPPVTFDTSPCLSPVRCARSHLRNIS